MSHEHPINAARRDEREAMARVWSAQQGKKNEDKKWRDGISESNVETIAQLKRQNEHLEKLVEDSANAIEQRNAVIRFMVESMIASDQPKETRLKKLLEYSTQFATLTGGANDVMEIINKAIEKLT